MTAVPARFYRQEEGIGECLISSGFPVPPGLVSELMVTDRKIKVFVGGEEVRCNVSALRGRHNDGSVRSVLIQFRYAMAQNDAVAASVVFDEGARATEDIAYTRPTYAMVFDANNVILPEGAEYLCSTNIALRRLIPSGEGSVSEEKLYTALAENRFSALEFSTNWGTASYEQCAAKVALWCRQGAGVKYWNAALRELSRWLNSATPAASGVTPPCLADSVANPDGRAGDDCGLPSEWDAARYYSFSIAYLMTGYRDFWGIVAYFAQRQQWNITSEADAQQRVVPYNANARARWNAMNKFGALIPALLIDATIPVDGQYHDGRAMNWAEQVDFTVHGMLHSEWDIRWIPFTDGSGAVPANYVVIAQGAASASLWGVYSARNMPKVETGQTMPVNGWLMVADVVGSFAAGALTGISATATGADETDYRNGFVGVKANAPLGVGSRGRTEFQLYQTIFPTNFLIDYYLYVKRDSRIPAIIKKTSDAVLANMRPTTASDYYHNQGDDVFGRVSWGNPYLFENPIDAEECTPWTLPMFTRMVAFVIKTLGDSTVNGRLFSEWYETLVDTANINPTSVLNWQWKHFGEIYGWNTDVPWMMAQETLVNYGPTTTKTPIQYTAIPGDTPDIGYAGIQNPPEEPGDPEDPAVPPVNGGRGALSVGGRLIRIGNKILRTG